MPFNATADSSRVQLSYIPEVTVGTTPSTPQMINVRCSGESLNANRTTQMSNEIRSDRNTTDLVTTAESASGDINFELSANEYDTFLEAVLQGTWATDVLKNGTARRSFTIEKWFSDVSKGNVFRGAELTTMSLNMQQGGFVSGSFGVMSRSSESTAVVLDATPTASYTDPVYNLTQHMTGLSINGSAYTDGIQNLAFTLNNNAREQRQIGSKNLAGVGMGTCQISGTMTAYFGSATAITTAYDNDTPVSLSWTLTNSGGTFVFTLPKVKFSSKTVVAGQQNQDVVLQLGWTAIYDTTEACMIKVTRS